MGELKRLLAPSRLTPAGVAAWYLALHAAWLLDVTELPAGKVAGCMQLGRTSALGAVLGARGVRYVGRRVPPGTFAIALERFVGLLHVAFDP